jgi:hypothetical protein
MFCSCTKDENLVCEFGMSKYGDLSKYDEFQKDISVLEEYLKAKGFEKSPVVESDYLPKKVWVYNGNYNSIGHLSILISLCKESTKISLVIIIIPKKSISENSYDEKRIIEFENTIAALTKMPGYSERERGHTPTFINFCE